MYSQHSERHFSNRNNWLRASVLGANDGLISTASLLTGVAAAAPDFQTLLLTGVSALIGGAVSMAAGEYVSVSSQSDTEKADLHKECYELEANPDAELAELTEIYRRRGLSDALAAEVAQALMEHDALSAHARNLRRQAHAGRACLRRFVLRRRNTAAAGRTDRPRRPYSYAGGNHFMRTRRTGLRLRQTRRRTRRSRRLARVPVGRGGIGCDRLYRQTGGRSGLNGAV